MAWQKLCPLEDIPPLGARVVEHEEGAIAVFRVQGEDVFALRDACPHKGGALSQGIVHGAGATARVTCPLHGWNIELDSGNACAPDEGCVQRRYPTKVEHNVVWLDV